MRVLAPALISSFRSGRNYYVQFLYWQDSALCKRSNEHCLEQHDIDCFEGCSGDVLFELASQGFTYRDAQYN